MMSATSIDSMCGKTFDYHEYEPKWRDALILLSNEFFGQSNVVIGYHDVEQHF